MAREFIITAISSSNSQNAKLNNCPQIPILLTIPGPISLRNKDDAYDVFLGEKEI